MGRGLGERGLHDVVGISTTPTAHPASARPITPPYGGVGRRPVASCPDPARRVKALVIEAGRGSAKPGSWREGSRPGRGRTGLKRMYSRFVALRIRPAGREIRDATEGVEPAECRVLAEWPAKEAEPVQFWLSDRPADTPLTTLVRPVELRWRIEHDHREAKQALGLAHFEGRTFNGWHHHVPPRLPRPRLLHPAEADPRPQRNGIGLSLYRVVREVQLLLATWAGACPTCHRDIPASIRT
ncbi:transposase [Streptomyces sp. NPDC058872]|uniref:transposase n=1 Tax=Streptomyces sp. NPDC058872 TaxID=3346661 RepID=UPI003673C358